MARRLIAAGFDVSICDANPVALAGFGEGAKAVHRPADIAGCDAIVLMVATDEQLMAVADAVAPALDPNRRTLVLVMSTCAPATTHVIGGSLGPRGARIVDAPVSGGRRGAEEGTLSVMVGGSPADIEAADPLIRSVGDKIFVCGPLGSGQAVKLLNNAIGLTNLYLMAEVLRIASALQVDHARLLPILEASSGRNALTKDLDRTRGLLATWSESDAIFDLLSRIVRKDLANASGLAESQGVQSPLLAALAELFSQHAVAERQQWKTLGSQPLD